MRVIGLWTVLVLLALAVFGGTASAGTDAERARVLQLVNEARAQNGLGPLQLNGSLTASGEAYALYMGTANFFSHNGPDGSTLVTRNEAAGYQGWTWMGENIAAGQTSADAVFQAWMNSPGHRANILSPKAREIGLGHALVSTSTYKHYWAMELGDRPNIATAPPPQPTATSVPPTPVPTATPVPPTPTPEIKRYVGAAWQHRLHIPSAPRVMRGAA